MSRDNPQRPDMLRDLTRWNRAGLKKLAYVDGDAAVWLEEVRLALFGLYLRENAVRPVPDFPLDHRLPEHWRNRFMQDIKVWGEPDDIADQARYAAAVAWSRLAPAMPPRAESRGQRSQRLLT